MNYDEKSIYYNNLNIDEYGSGFEECKFYGGSDSYAEFDDISDGALL